ncbi:fimbrial biogenesis chaperone [Yersinia sp. J1]|uniref:fimbrial biogenesis chaperone n=1 Tax=Yersinia sp. J1 TaxID=3424774 RepID=UPI003D367A4E
MTIYAKNIIACILLALASIVSFAAQASVVMTGTRVVYPEGTREKILQLSNKDDNPNLVQIWMDDGNNQSSPTKDDVPFLLTPQIFRMEPQSGQVVRLAYIERNLPKDRESVFYLNFLQIPAMKADKQANNKLVLIVKNRLKVFYRPTALNENTDNLHEKIQVSLSDNTGQKITINNPTGYFISLRDAQMTVNNKIISFASSEMVSPKSSSILTIPEGIKAIKGQQLTLTLVNDYGANISTIYSL